MSLFGIKMKTIIQATSWNPFESYLLGAAFAAGLSGLFAKNETSQVVLDKLPIWVLYTWYLGLVIGAVLGLIGVHINVKLKLHLELTGIGILGGISAGYSVLIAIASNRPFAYSVFITLAFSLACFARTVQLIKTLRKLDKLQEVMAP